MCSFTFFGSLTRVGEAGQGFTLKLSTFLTGFEEVESSEQAFR